MRLKICLGICLLSGFIAPISGVAQTDILNVKTGFDKFIVPTVFVGYGLASLAEHNALRNLDLTTRAELQEDHPRFAAHADDYLQYSPALIVYGLHVAGVKGKHDLADVTGLFILSQGLMGGSVWGLKNSIQRLRPNGSGMNSFPSGHTATAFAGAEFLRQEYKDTYPWIGYAGYGLATATGILRMYNNKHWLSDVVTGAGIGILSTKISYLAYPKLQQLLSGKGQKSSTLVPVYQQRHFGLAFHAIF